MSLNQVHNNFIHLYLYHVHVGLFYYVLGNIDPALRSGLNTIQLLCIVRCIHIEKYGMDVILQPFVEDIQKLESVSTVHIHDVIEFGTQSYLYRTSTQTKHPLVSYYRMKEWNLTLLKVCVIFVDLCQFAPLTTRPVIHLEGSRTYPVLSANVAIAWQLTLRRR